MSNTVTNLFDHQKCICRTAISAHHQTHLMKSRVNKGSLLQVITSNPKQDQIIFSVYMYVCMNECRQVLLIVVILIITIIINQ